MFPESPVAVPTTGLALRLSPPPGLRAFLCPAAASATSPPTWLLLSAGRFLSRILRLLLSSRLVPCSLRAISSGERARGSPTSAPTSGSPGPDPADAAILPAQRRTRSPSARAGEAGGREGSQGGLVGAGGARKTPQPAVVSPGRLGHKGSARRGSRAPSARVLKFLGALRAPSCPGGMLAGRKIPCVGRLRKG